MQLVFEKVTRVYRGVARESIIALDDLSLVVEPGASLCVIGHSGSGKTTLLRLAAGLESPTSGRVLLNGTSPASIAPRQRDLAFAPQAPVLFPHLNVRQNLTLGPQLRKVSRAETERRVQQVSQGLRIGDLLQRFPHELSGGQRQRVSLGRALSVRPGLLLLDEPFANLDPDLGQMVRGFVVQVARDWNATLVCVIHDREEGRQLSPNVVELRAGRLQSAA